ncbi:hypothetical protein DFJ58DRAFT_742476, partial [Suillus subalutaceus]|uniref:uncharacterized protein n=1 Tax=Suillus subalutaceus TaxID=48586 RepID=UPI001B885275
MSIFFALLRPTNYSHLFLSPTLRSCHQQYIDPDFILMMTRAALEHLFIESLDWVSMEDIADKLSSLSQSVRSCKQLVTLTCLPLDLAAWEHLSNLHTLLEI